MHREFVKTIIKSNSIIIHNTSKIQFQHILEYLGCKNLNDITFISRCDPNNNSNNNDSNLNQYIIATFKETKKIDEGLKIMKNITIDGEEITTAKYNSENTPVNDTGCPINS